MARTDLDIEVQNAGHQSHRVEEEEARDALRSKALATEQDLVPSGYFLGINMISTVAAIGLSVTAFTFVFTAPAAVLTFINEDIGPSPNTSLFSVVLIVSQPISALIFGRLSDRFGRRWFAIGANLLGLIGSIVACTAQNMNSLIGANVLLGLGYGVPACYPLLIGELMPAKYKYVGLSLCIIPDIIANGFAPYIARALIETANWRWLYYIYIMITVPATILYFFFYYPPSFTQLHGSERGRIQELRRLDYLGGFLLVSGMSLFLLGVAWGGQPIPWTSARILSLLIVGFATFVAFVIYEAYGGVRHPLVPTRLFKDLRGYVCLCALAAVGGVVYTAANIIWPSQVVNIYGSTSSGWKETAWLTSTIGFGVWTGIVIYGQFFHLIRNIRWQMVVFSVWMTAMMGGLAGMNQNNRSAAIAVSFLSTIPSAVLQDAPALLCQYITDDQDLAISVGIIVAMRTAWGAVFTAVFLAILSNKTTSEVPKHVIPAVTAAGLPLSSITDLFTAISNGTTSALESVPGMSPSILTAISVSLSNGYAAAYAYVYYASVAVGAVGIIAAFCLRDFDQYLTGHVSRQIYGRNERNADMVDEKIAVVVEEEENTVEMTTLR